MSDLPLCACGEFYLSHHPECPARRAFEEALSRLDEVLADRSTAREHLQRERDRADSEAQRAEAYKLRIAALDESIAGCARKVQAVAAERDAALLRLEKTENQNRFLRSWIRELREDGADAVSVDPLYGMLRDRIAELARTDPAADSPDGARLTALADLCEAYEKRRGESAVGIVTAESEVNSKSRLKRIAVQRAARESAGVEKQENNS